LFSLVKVLESLMSLRLFRGLTAGSGKKLCRLPPLKCFSLHGEISSNYELIITQLIIRSCLLLPIVRIEIKYNLTDLT